jgi:putative membrane protein
VDGPSPLTSWTVEPLQLVPILIVGLLYGRRAHVLARRGNPVARWRLWSFGAGLGLLVLALASPIDALGEEQFLWAHMVQHVLIGDLAPLALVLGLTGPLLQPILSFRTIQRLRVLAHPVVALPLWAIDLYVWHLPLLYEAALHHTAIHALEHACFLAAGMLMWAPVVEVLPGPAWFGTAAKLGYVVAVRLLETVLGNIFVWSGTVFYSFYEHPVARWGISAHSDQGIAGAIMMIEGSIVTLAVLAWLFLKWGAESELRQQLIEQGIDPAVASRAVRYGRGEEIAGRR